MRVQGGHPQDLVLDLGPADVGPFLVVTLSETAASSAEWRIDVFVELPGGKYALGHMTTTSPAAGDPPSRVVLHALCSGAHGWSITVRGPDDAMAEVTMATGMQGATAPGVSKVAH